MFIAYSFLSRRDIEKKLKTPSCFSHQDASKYVPGDLEKSIWKFDPRSWLLTLTHFVQILRPYRKYAKSKFKRCFPTHWGIWNKNPVSTPFKSKKVFLAPPPPPYWSWSHRRDRYPICYNLHWSSLKTKFKKIKTFYLQTSLGYGPDLRMETIFLLYSTKKRLRTSPYALYGDIPSVLSRVQCLGFFYKGRFGLLNHCRVMECRAWG